MRIQAKTLLKFSVIFCCLLTFTACKRHSHSNEKLALEGDQIVHMSTSADPLSLDPRQVRDLGSVTILHMLYDGLMRLDNHGKPQNALAQSVTLSPDKKQYTFKLRPSFWSNGSPLTAFQFEQTWKTLLDPHFPAPNAYQFYVIKGAKAAKEGKLTWDQVGIKASDALTLIIELESATPYFLDLVSTHFYYPCHPDFSLEKPLTNGPFKLHSWKKQNELIVSKNKHYWDANEVRLDHIIVTTLEDFTALRLYENGELDWIGSPMGTLPQDALATLKHQHHLAVSPAAGVHWFRLNTAKVPFNNSKMRSALALSLNRHEIVEHVTQGNQKIAEAIVPASFGLKRKSFFKDNSSSLGWYTFQEALEELKISKDELPTLTLCYSATERNSKVAQTVQQQWKKALGIEVQLESYESQLFFDKISREDYQVALGSWYADIGDPINFLTLFKDKDTGMNHTHWQEERYTSLLDQSDQVQDVGQRLALLDEAQSVLLAEMPIIPLFFGSFNYVKTEGLLGVYFSELGYVDFKHAFFGN